LTLVSCIWKAKICFLTLKGLQVHFKSVDCQGAALIRRRLCGGSLEGLQVQSDDQFLTQSLDTSFHLSLLAGEGRGKAAG